MHEIIHHQILARSQGGSIFSHVQKNLAEASQKKNNKKSWVCLKILSWIQDEVLWHIWHGRIWDLHVKIFLDKILAIYNIIPIIIKISLTGIISPFVKKQERPNTTMTQWTRESITLFEGIPGRCEIQRARRALWQVWDGNSARSTYCVFTHDPWWSQLNNSSS